MTAVTASRTLPKSGARFALRILGGALAATLIVASTSTAQAVPARVKRECKSDYKSFCPSYAVGTAKMRACMRANGRQLAWGCYQALKDAGYVKK